jgi:hypothetical protein
VSRASNKSGCNARASLLAPSEEAQGVAGRVEHDPYALGVTVRRLPWRFSFLNALAALRDSYNDRPRDRMDKP